MQYITIKKEEINGTEIFVINAISLKYKGKSTVQKIPHPLGTDILHYETLEDAKEAITRAGFSYILPDGKKGTKTISKIIKTTSEYDYSQIVLDSIKNKINSQNTNISAAAILAICEFPTEETFDILFEKIGEDNDLIRKNAISGICRYGNLLEDRIIQTLKSPNWVTRNSILTCISTLSEANDIDIEHFIIPLTEITNDTNPIVQTNAITTLAKVYQTYKKTKKL